MNSQKSKSNEIINNVNSEVVTRVAPLALRRSTHIYCTNCNVPAEYYESVDCTWCGLKNVKWNGNRGGNPKM